MDSEIIQALKVTAEVCGTEFTESAVSLIAQELSKFDKSSVLAALKRCCYEVKGRLSFADIVSRIQDERPGVEEAWAMIPKSENDSVVWTTEMQEAYGSCRPLLMDGDPVAARMAFKEAYIQITARGRSVGTPVRWEMSLGFDPAGRAVVLNDAVAKGRLPETVLGMLPPDYQEQSKAKLPRMKGSDRMKKLL